MFHGTMKTLKSSEINAGLTSVCCDLRLTVILISESHFSGSSVLLVLHCSVQPAVQKTCLGIYDLGFFLYALGWL